VSIQLLYCLPHEPQYLCCAYAKSTGEPRKRFTGKNGRCKLHGGYSTGAKNPIIRHGRYAKKSLALNAAHALLLRESKALMKEMIN